MLRKRIPRLVGIILVIISLIVIIPIYFLSTGLSKYGRIDENPKYEFDQTDSSPIKILNLNVDVGNIDIKYVNPPVDFVVKIEVDIEMNGILTYGESYTDYFSLTDEIVDSQVNFNLKFKPNIDRGRILTLLNNLQIIVFLRADNIFNIDIYSETGNVNLVVPFGVIINDLDINVTTGNALLGFNHCMINGNLTGMVNRGDLRVTTYNVEYSKDSIWRLNTNIGEVTVEITHLNQLINLEANIKGIIETNNGDITLDYQDNSKDVGAMISLQPARGSQLDWPGFSGIPVENSYLFTSLDLPSKITYNLSCNLNIGEYDFQLSSYPF
jgi:hypothetical protein